MAKPEEKRPAWVRLFPERLKFCSLMSDADVGAVFKASLVYFQTGEISENLSEGQTILFITMKEGIDESITDYSAKSAINTENAKKRWGKDHEKQGQNELEEQTNDALEGG